MFAQILADLAQAGFDARWCVLGADDVGAPHRRKRLWILADYRQQSQGAAKIRPGSEPINSDSSWLKSASRDRSSNSSEDVADSEGERHGGRDHQERGGEGRIVQPKEREGREMGREVEGCGSAHHKWWSTEPNVGRVAHGVASRVDRLKALGNGQVPAVAATAWTILSTGT